MIMYRKNRSTPLPESITEYYYAQRVITGGGFIALGITTMKLAQKIRTTSRLLCTRNGRKPDFLK